MRRSTILLWIIGTAAMGWVLASHALAQWARMSVSWCTRADGLDTSKWSSSGWPLTCGTESSKISIHLKCMSSPAARSVHIASAQSNRTATNMWLRSASLLKEYTACCRSVTLASVLSQMSRRVRNESDFQKMLNFKEGFTNTDLESTGQALRRGQAHRCIWLAQIPVYAQWIYTYLYTNEDSSHMNEKKSTPAWYCALNTKDQPISAIYINDNINEHC